MKIEASYTPDEDTTDTSQSPADAAATTPDKPLTPEQLDAKALAGFEQGLAVAEGKAPPKEDADGVSDAVVIEGDDTVTDPAQPKAKAAPKADEDQPELDPEVETEITQRALKGESAERFRNLANDSKRLKELEPQIEQLQVQAARADQWQNAVESTGATPAQFGMAMGLLHALNSGKPEALNQAFDAMQDELRRLGGILGREISAVDPLAVDPELLDRVKKGEVGREEALRTLRAETEARLLREGQQRQTTAQTAQQAQADAVAAVTAVGNALAAELETAFPGKGAELYAAKLTVLAPSIRLIRETTPPAEWPERITNLWKATPQPAAAAKPKTAPTQSPTRPGNHTSHSITAKPKSDVDAFSIGLALANERR
jgi:hypothetical protein